MSRLPILGSAVLMFSQAVLAEDLLTVYQRALAADPLIREAGAPRLAVREPQPRAPAGLLRQIRGTAGDDKNQFEGPSDQAQVVSEGAAAGSITILSTPGTREPETETWSLDLRQS